MSTELTTLTPFPARMSEIKKEATQKVRRWKRPEGVCFRERAALISLRVLHNKLGRAIAALESGTTLRADELMGDLVHKCGEAERRVRDIPQVQERDRLLREDPEYQALFGQWLRADSLRSRKMLRKAFRVLANTQ